MSGAGTFSAIVEAYLLALDAGERPDREALVARHPEHAGALRAFFADQDRLLGAAGPLAPPRVGRIVGYYELLEEIVARLPAGEVVEANADETAVAFVGRPNVGKSSLVNRLLRAERVMVSEMPASESS